MTSKYGGWCRLAACVNGWVRQVGANFCCKSASVSVFVVGGGRAFEKARQWLQTIYRGTPPPTLCFLTCRLHWPPSFLSPTPPVHALLLQYKSTSMPSSCTTTTLPCPAAAVQEHQDLRHHRGGPRRRRDQGGRARGRGGRWAGQNNSSRTVVLVSKSLFILRGPWAWWGITNRTCSAHFFLHSAARGAALQVGGSGGCGSPAGAPVHGERQRWHALCLLLAGAGSCSLHRTCCTPTAGIVPCTNPTSTAIFKSLLALKTRNALILCPHPRAAKCTAEAARIVRDAAVAAGAPGERAEVCSTGAQRQPARLCLVVRAAAGPFLRPGAGLGVQ